jgi:hypothetical protein
MSLAVGTSVLPFFTLSYSLPNLTPFSSLSLPSPNQLSILGGLIQSTVTPDDGII